MNLSLACYPRNAVYVSLQLVVLFFVNEFSSAQVLGISGSKLCVPEASTDSVGVFEFEPSFSVFQAGKEYQPDGTTESLHGYDRTSCTMIRVTVGIADNLEAGTSFSGTLDQVSLGAKFVPLNSNEFHLGVMAGATLPSGNGFTPDSLSDGDAGSSISLGTLASIQISDKSSTDIALTYTQMLGSNSFHEALDLNAGIGYWTSTKLQGVIELNGFMDINDGIYADKLSIIPGFTYKATNSLLIVAGMQLDLTGKNQEEGFGYFAAFTITLN